MYICEVIAHFVPNFVPIATRVSRGKIRLAAFGGSSTKPPFRRKNLADISCTDRVIALFAPNFVAMATGVDQGKYDLQHLIAHPRNPLYRRKNIADISYTRRVIANFVPNFVAVATGVGREKMQLAAFDGPSLKTTLQAQKSRKNLLRKSS